MGKIFQMELKNIYFFHKNRNKTRFPPKKKYNNVLKIYNL